MRGAYALLWSGGKDGALALDRARRRGLEVRRLITFYDPATGRVRFHGTRVSMLHAQAGAIGVELRAVPTAWEAMDGRLRAELGRLREEGFAGVVLGDIHLADVRAWYEGRVREAGLEHVEPLWGEPPAALLTEFVEGGGRAVLTCVELARLDETWLGRVIDADFVRDVARLPIDPCGERGEYHSFAFAGPAFRRPVDWRPGRRRSDGRFAQLDLLPGWR
ncbi:MAG TPA: hypothetical protein VFD49_10910 [Candidatus Dormibacteraeota bacterium]|nr:hypothetical protein [Candidatus Dormibacteraeota bacterium]